jgi:LmbE family N-acetylglucosaminyl deacetylase
MNKSILLVFAHPDDESFGLSGTISKYTHQGIQVDLICATRGEVGTRVNVPKNIKTGVARESELRTAAFILGIRSIYFLDYIDGELEKLNIGEIIDKVKRIMQKVQPEIIITFGPDGITGHPDHITIGKAATRAFEQLKGTPSSPRKLYYATIPESEWPDASESGVTTMPDEKVTTTIDITGYLENKIEAISAHRSQKDTYEFIKMLKSDPESTFAKKEFVYLAQPGISTKETDLFE